MFYYVNKRIAILYTLIGNTSVDFKTTLQMSVYICQPVSR